MFKGIVILFLIGNLTPAVSADFNITLRKTDYQQLKQQVLPVIDENISQLRETLTCMKNGTSASQCIKQHPLVNNDLKTKLDDVELSADEYIHDLTLVINEAELARECVVKSQSIDQLKECIKDNYN